MSSQNISDIAIIEAIKLGSEKVLFGVYDQYRNEFVGWALTNHNLTVDESKDIFQNAIIAFNQNIKEGKFDGKNSSLKTYLFSIGKNYIRIHFRATKNMYLHDDLENHLTITKEEPNTELQEIVKAAVSKIGDRCKSILLLFYERGWDMESIAIEFGLKNRDVAKKTKYECMKKLESEIKERLKSA